MTSVAGIERRAAGQEGVRERRPAVVGERSQAADRSRRCRRCELGLPMRLPLTSGEPSGASTSVVPRVVADQAEAHRAHWQADERPQIGRSPRTTRVARDDRMIKFKLLAAVAEQCNPPAPLDHPTSDIAVIVLLRIVELPAKVESAGAKLRRIAGDRAGVDRDMIRRSA